MFLGMKSRLWVVVITLTLLTAPQITDAQQTPDARVADLVRAGRIRMALFPPQYSKNPVTGELKCIWADSARALAARIGVELVLVEHPTPLKMMECLKAGACDVGSLGFDPARAGDVEAFSPPFIEFDYTYLVRAGSSIRNIADVDQPDVRIAVVNAHASTLTLTRRRKRAELVSVDTPDTAFELLRTGRVDAFASARPVLIDYSTQLPGSRVLKQRYGANRPALVVAKGHPA